MKHVLVVSGGFLAFWSLVGLLYFEFFRVPFAPCEFGEVRLDELCWSPWKFFVPLLILGTALGLFGAFAVRIKPRVPEDLLRAGVGMRLLMTLMASMAVLPLVFAAIAASVEADQGRDELVRWGDNAYDTVSVLVTLGIVGFLAFALAFGVHLFHDGLRRRYLAELEYHARLETEASGHTRHGGHDAPPPHGVPRGSLPEQGFSWRDR